MLPVEGDVLILQELVDAGECSLRADFILVPAHCQLQSLSDILLVQPEIKRLQVNESLSVRVGARVKLVLLKELSILAEQLPTLGEVAIHDELNCSQTFLRTTIIDSLDSLKSHLQCVYQVRLVGFNRSKGRTHILIHRVFSLS